VNAAWEGATDADVVLLLVDARTGLTDDVTRIAEKLKQSPSRRVLVLNKIDIVKRERLLALAGELNELCLFEETFMISASTGDGVQEMKGKLTDLVPPGPWLYPEDQLSDIPQRLIASEITREKIYERLHQELPYASTVETENWEERPDGSLRIEQVIFVERENQRKIILGKGGQSIREIGRLAREELSSMLERKVHLFLFVKVRENWATDPERLRAMGLKP